MVEGVRRVAQRRNIAWTGAALALAIAALLFWAWHDGGREELREISYPVPVPAERGR